SPWRMYSTAILSYSGRSRGLRSLMKAISRPGVTHAGTVLVGESLMGGRLSAARLVAGRSKIVARTPTDARNDIRHLTRLRDATPPTLRAHGFPLSLLGA